MKEKKWDLEIYLEPISNAQIIKVPSKEWAKILPATLAETQKKAHCQRFSIYWDASLKTAVINTN